MDELKTSEEWYTFLYPNREVVIMDPDGWDRRNWQFSWFEEKITSLQFTMRVMSSTCKIPRDENGRLKLI